MGAVALSAGRLLVIRRGRGPAQGQWSIPGGRVEYGETLAEAVVREVAEETGLQVACAEVLGWVERITDEAHHVIVDYLVVPLDDEEPHAGDDAAEATWVRVEDVAELALVDGLAEFLAEHGIIELLT